MEDRGHENCQYKVSCSSLAARSLSCQTLQHLLLRSCTAHWATAFRVLLRPSGTALSNLQCVISSDAGLLAISQYSEGPATDHLDTGFSWFPCAYKQMLRWFPRFQVATTCFSCSSPDLNLLVNNFIFCIHVK